MAHVQLVTVDGEALGPGGAPPAGLAAGVVIYRDGAGPNLRVIKVLPAEDPETSSILVVEKTG